MNPKLTISTASFHYWYSKFPDLRLLEKNIASLLTDSSDFTGLEFHGTFDELKSWSVALRDGRVTLPGPLAGFQRRLTLQLLALPDNSVHLPSLARFSAEDTTVLADVINTLGDIIGIRRFVAHPDNVELVTWRRLGRQLENGISISIENMDPRKSSHRTLDEIGGLLDEFPFLTTTIDICHWIDHGHPSSDRVLLQFMTDRRERIDGIHFSVPKSQSALYRRYPEIETSHYLAHDSRYLLSPSFFAAIPPHATIVVEGVIPRGEFLCVRRELSHVATHLTDLPEYRQIRVRRVV